MSARDDDTPDDPIVRVFLAAYVTICVIALVMAVIGAIEALFL